jgi:cobalt-zinc-cadmium efflux system outer membrane protein
LCAAGALWPLPGSLGAQVSAPRRALTLAEARDLARWRSPELEAARQAAASAAGRERQAGAWPNPTLAYGREQTSRAGESNAQDIVSFEQRLEIGGQRGARRRGAALSRAAAEARVDAMAAQVDFEVARAYAAAVAAERRAAFAEEAAAAFSRAVRTTETRLAGGDVSGFHHRRLKLESARYAAARLEALTVRDSALYALASLTGLADSADAYSFQLVDTLVPAPLPAPVDSLVTLALARRPELRASRLEADAGVAEARLTASERIPNPVVSGGYKHERQVGTGGLGGFVVGASLPLPLWDRRGGAVAAAHAEARRRTSEWESERLRTVREVRAAYNAHQVLVDELAILGARLDADAPPARRAAEAAYAEGEISLLEWLDSVRAYQEAQIRFAMLWAEYVARRAALERATGATLF